jgi:hypothetical protein
MRLGALEIDHLPLVPEPDSRGSRCGIKIHDFDPISSLLRQLMFELMLEADGRATDGR